MGATLAMGYKFLKADATAEQIDADLGNHDYADGHAVMLELNPVAPGNWLEQDYPPVLRRRLRPARSPSVLPIP